MKLLEVLEDLRISRPLSKGSLENYRRAVRYFQDYLGRDAVVTDLTTRAVNGWLTLEETRHAGSYCRSLRRDLKVIWNFAADSQLCPHPRSRLLRRAIEEEKVVSSWPLEWIPKLIEASQRIEGNIRRHHVPRAAFCEAYFRVQVDLLCRPTDMRMLRWGMISAKGEVTWTQNKTRRGNRMLLSAESMRAIQALKGMHDIFVFPMSKNAIELMIRKIFDIAGIKKPRKESLGHLRHTGGTAIAVKQGCDAARKALGHTPASKVFEQFYLDASKLPSTPVEQARWWQA